MLQLHDAHPGDLEDTSFPAPEGRVPMELCLFGGRRSNGNCGQTLTEWVRPDETPEAEKPIEPTGDRDAIAVAPAHRAWAKAEGFRLADAGTLPGHRSRQR